MNRQASHLKKRIYDLCYVDESLLSFITCYNRLKLIFLKKPRKPIMTAPEAIPSTSSGYGNYVYNCGAQAVTYAGSACRGIYGTATRLTNFIAHFSYRSSLETTADKVRDFIEERPLALCSIVICFLAYNYKPKYLLTACILTHLFVTNDRRRIANHAIQQANQIPNPQYNQSTETTHLFSTEEQYPLVYQQDLQVPEYSPPLPVPVNLAPQQYYYSNSPVKKDNQ